MRSDLYGAMARLDIQRRRTKYPPSGEREVESAKTWFFTDGETGKCIYHFVQYIRFANTKSPRSRTGDDVRRKSREMLLKHIQAWLAEPVTDVQARLRIIRNAANTCGKYGFAPMHNGHRADSIALKHTPAERRRLTGFFDQLDNTRWPQDVKSFFRDFGSLLVAAEARLFAPVTTTPESSSVAVE